jgi:uncharacterized membrane protein
MTAHHDDDLHHFDTQRVEAFSDGVLAIAITLLVLEIGVPGPGSSLGSALEHEWPSFLGFGISFITIGIMWINHHGVFRDIERVDHKLLVLNLLLLLSISFLPFGTAVFAEHLRDEDNRRLATLFLGANFTVIAVFFNALWFYVYFHRAALIDHHVSVTRLQSRTRRYLSGPFIYGVTLPLAFISPWISVAIYIGAAVLYLLPLNEEQVTEPVNIETPDVG